MLNDIAVVIVITVLGGASAGLADTEDLPRTKLTGQVELARLVDLAAERLNLNIEYDASALRGQVTLRLGAGVTDDELWMLTNRVLASRGFATVQMPGEDMVSVVQIRDAPGMARLEGRAVDLEGPATKAGYTTIIVQPEHQPAQKLIDGLKLVLSRTGSEVTRLGDSDFLLISDLKPRIEQAKQILDVLDVPVAPPVIRKLPLAHIEATQLASIVTSAARARDTLTGRPLRGKLTPLPDGTAIVLMAPSDEEAFWMSMIEQFDAREAVTTETYTPLHFGVGEVARLIEDSIHIAGPRGSGDRWRMVTDELTGAVIVTATPSEHAQIEQLLNRLAEVPREARRPVRMYSIRNRHAGEMREILSNLMDIGALETDLEGNPSSSAHSEQTSRPEGARWADETRRAQQDDLATLMPRTPRRGSWPTGDGSLTMTVDEATNSILAVGDPRQLAQLDEVIRRLDIRRSQVMLEVLVLSLSESQTRNLGVELQKMEIRGSTMIRLASVFGLGPSNLLTMTDTPSPGQGGTGVVLSPGDFSVLLRALETMNEGRSLSVPKVLVNNNELATLDSVRQEPFTTLVAADTVATTTFGGTLDAGTVVTVTPQIAEADHLLLDYSVSLSSFVGEAIDSSVPPPRQQDRLASQVTIPDGYAVALGGLELSSQSEGITQVPLLGDIPLLGEAFKSRSRTTSRSRFFVFIRANVLRHEGFEDLRYLSEQDLEIAGLDAVVRDWPQVEPRIIR